MRSCMQAAQPPADAATASEHPAPAGDAAPAPMGLPEDVQATWAALRQWVDTASDTSYCMLHARVEARAGRCVLPAMLA